MRILLLTLFLSLLSSLAVEGRSGRSCAQTVQRIGTSAREYGSSFQGSLPGARPNQIQVGTTIPYVTMNREAPESSALINGGAPGLQAPQNFGNGFGLNPLLRGGAAGGPVISQPILPSGPGSAQYRGPSRRQAYNPYTGKVYGKTQPQNRRNNYARNQRQVPRKNSGASTQNPRRQFKRTASSQSSKRSNNYGR